MFRVRFRENLVASAGNAPAACLPRKFHERPFDELTNSAAFSENFSRDDDDDDDDVIVFFRAGRGSARRALQRSLTLRESYSKVRRIWDATRVFQYRLERLTDIASLARENFGIISEARGEFCLRHRVEWTTFGTGSGRLRRVVYSANWHQKKERG